MSSIHKPLALLRALTPLLLFIVIEAAGALILVPPTVVQINNTLESKSSLQIHCKDKYYDLGVHIVPYSQTYEFKIRTFSKLGRTLYFCGFVWEHKLRWFDVYVKSRDEPLCGNNCRWFVEDSGPCLSGTPTGVRCFPWNKD